METAAQEPFVDAATAGKFLSLSVQRVQALARDGRIPGYPLGTGTRRAWRFRLSEIAETLKRTAQPVMLVAGDSYPSYASKPRKRVARGSLRRDKVSAG